MEITLKLPFLRASRQYVPITMNVFHRVRPSFRPFFFSCILAVALLLVALMVLNNSSPVTHDDGGSPEVRFSDPDNLHINGSTFTHLAMIAYGISNQTMNGYKMRLTFRKLLRSIIFHTYDRPVHLIMITELEGIRTIRNIFLEEHPPIYLFNFIHQGKQKVPRFALEFVDVTSILDRVRKWNSPLKRYFNNHGGSYRMSYEDDDGETEKTVQIGFAEKYNHDMFYIAPFYHRIFTNIEKLAIVDLDVEFLADVEKLRALFDEFDDGEMIGVANDLAPHYHQMLHGYRQKHPNTSFGMPGRFQGLNVGVLLQDLTKMRKSSLYNQLLTEDEVTRLANKYEMTATHLGEQDWFTLVSFEHPELIHPLPCTFNRQMSMDYNSGPWKDIFHLFHDCPEAELNGGKPFIVHGNSDSGIASSR